MPNLCQNKRAEKEKKNSLFESVFLPENASYKIRYMTGSDLSGYRPLLQTEVDKNVFIIYLVVCMMPDVSLFTRYKKTALAVSGGKDSMCMLHFVLHNVDLEEIPIFVVNINHNLRAGSDSDSAFVESFCRENNIDFLPYSVDISKSIHSETGGIELKARNARYAIFTELVKTGAAAAVATAHHASDNAESLLMNLFRGASLAGAAGIAAVRQDGIIRPLLRCMRSQIDEYASKYSVPFVADPTNSDDAYTRNYIRNTIMPAVKRAYPNAETALNSFIDLASQDNAYLDSLTPEPDRESNAVILRANYLSLPPPLARRYIIKGVKLLLPDSYERRHSEIIQSLTRLQTGSGFDLGSGVRASRSYGDIILSIADSGAHTDPVPFSFGNINTGIKHPGQYSKPLRFDPEKIPDGSVIRTRRDGDMFKKFGGGSKTFNKYLIDIKVPARFRDSLMLVCYNNEVLIAVGLEISESVKIADPKSKVGIAVPDGDILKINIAE